MKTLDTFVRTSLRLHVVRFGIWTFFATALIAPNLEGGRASPVRSRAASVSFAALPQFDSHHGNVVSATDGLGKATTFVYDSRDRRVSSLDRVAGTTRFTYDLAGHLLSIQDADALAAGQAEPTTVYAYDARGLLIAEAFRNQTPEDAFEPRDQRFYTIDAARRLATRTDQRSVITGYGYDYAARLTMRGYSNRPTQPDAFGYDGASRVISATSGRYRTAVTRDFTANGERAGRLQAETTVFTGQPIGPYTVAYGYDAANRLTTVTDPGGAIHGRTYTQRNQLDVSTFNGAIVADRTYDAGGRLSAVTLGNGLTETRTYEAGSNLAQTITVPGATGFAYTYDGNRRKTSETRSDTPTATQAFTYDDADRLTGWTRGGTAESAAWTLSKVGDWTSTTTNNVTETRKHNTLHAVTRINGQKLAYDARGNLTSDDRGTQYRWDDENRLVSATIRDQEEGISGKASYAYDAFGRRIQRTVWGITTTFIHDGARVIQEIDTTESLPATAQGDGAWNETEIPPGGSVLGQTNTFVRLTFQPDTRTLPDGFVADIGKKFNLRGNGFSYGWNKARLDQTVSRFEHPFVQYDTFIQVKPTAAASSAGTWNLAVANGTYSVVIVAGDPSSTNQTNRFALEGTLLTDPDPAVPDGTTYNRGDFDGWVTTVTVTDGTLTLTAAPGALNPKLCWIEIGKPGIPAPAGAAADLAAKILAATGRTGGTPFPARTPSPRRYSHGAYIDDMAMIDVAGQRYWLHDNHLFSPSALTDAAGTVVERYQYSAYGARTVLAPNGATRTQSQLGNPVSFTGLMEDPATKLLYARNRWMETRLGRWLSRDPLGYVDGSSLYAGYFVPNTIDPTGMLTPTEFWEWEEDRRNQWFKQAKDRLGNAIRNSSKNNCIPEELLWAIVVNEMLEYDWRESLGEDIGFGHSVGVAQVSIQTAIDFNLTDHKITTYNPIPQVNFYGEVMAVTSPNEQLQYDVRMTLRTDAGSVEAAARLIRANLDAACKASKSGNISQSFLSIISIGSNAGSIAELFCGECPDDNGNKPCEKIVRSNVPSHVIAGMAAMYNNGVQIIGAENIPQLHPNAETWAGNASLLDDTWP